MKNRITLIFTNKNEHDKCCKRYAHSVWFGLLQCYNNRLLLNTHNDETSFYKNGFEHLSDENKIGIVGVSCVKNFEQVKKHLNIKLIKAYATILGLRFIENNKLPPIVFDCSFPVSEIPIDEIKKFTIIIIN